MLVSVGWWGRARAGLPCGAVTASAERIPLMIPIDSPGLTVGEKFTLQIKSDDRCSSKEYTEQLNYVEHRLKQCLLVTYVTSEPGGSEKRLLYFGRL